MIATMTTTIDKATTMTIDARPGPPGIMWRAVHASLGWARRPWFALLVFCLAASALALLSTGGAFRSVENGLREWSAAIQPKASSGRLHLVEMDAASMARYDRWPWPRENYAAAIERLDRAGVRTIAFDVDFSAASNPAADAALARAIANADAHVILPTFAQAARFAGEGAAVEQRMLDTLPLEALREHASLGSVSVLPDGDGRVRSMPLGTVTQGTPRPSVAAALAGRSGMVDQPFPIDLGIDPATIPRHSFADIADGAFDVKALEGRDVLIGATAVELYDRYAMPRHGILPGVVVQALATETLYAGVPRQWGPALPLLLAIMAAMAILGARTRRAVAARLAVGGLSALVLAALAWRIALLEVAIVPALALLAFAAAWALVRIRRRRRRTARHTDPQTGLPNMRAYKASVGHGAERFVVAAMIDAFDTVRTVVGEDGVPDLLARAVERLQAGGAHGAVYRIDERTLAWRSDEELYRIEDQLAGIAALMRSPLEVAGKRIDVQMHFGIAEAASLAGAAHAASQAMRRKERWRYHEDAQSTALAEQISLMGELDEGVANGQLRVFYQPKLDIRTHEISGVEALVRWQHPTRGFLRPDIFIPLAEENDRIHDLTVFVLRQTIDDLARWCENGLVVGAAVNISARLLSNASFLERSRELITASGVPRERLTFEVTESAELVDADAARAGLEEFRKLGVRISMDDYGTGQSTLSYLKNLPLSELKIDRSFVQFAHTDPGDAMLVRSTVQLAHELGLQVVAEGVEEPECLDFLREIQCDYAQGYLIGKPMQSHDLVEAIGTQRPRAA